MKKGKKGIWEQRRKKEKGWKVERGKTELSQAKGEEKEERPGTERKGNVGKERKREGER